MNGRYALAETPHDRLAIAVIAANLAYFREYPSGVAPGQVFLSEYLKPFIERELLEARVDELHERLEKTIAPRELELVTDLMVLRHKCINKISNGDVVNR